MFSKDNRIDWLKTNCSIFRFRLSISIKEGHQKHKRQMKTVQQEDLFLSNIYSYDGLSKIKNLTLICLRGVCVYVCVCVCVCGGGGGGGVKLTLFPCVFSKTASSKKRGKPWLFVTFNIISKHIFSENFIEFPEVVQKIRGNSLPIFAIFINCPQFSGVFNINLLQRN